MRSRHEPTTAERPKAGTHATDPRGPNGAPTRKHPIHLTIMRPTKGGNTDIRCYIARLIGAIFLKLQ
eukprot:COSAG01_NODE_63252_length_280_cov_12.801105_1_plen_66_part_01